MFYKFIIGLDAFFWELYFSMSITHIVCLMRVKSDIHGFHIWANESQLEGVVWRLNKTKILDPFNLSYVLSICFYVLKVNVAIDDNTLFWINEAVFFFLSFVRYCLRVLGGDL